MTALGLGLIVLGLLLATLLLQLWVTGTVVGGFPVLPFGRTVQGLHPEVRLLLIVMVAGALGSFIHAATSFGDFVGNDQLTRSWIWWYLLKPFIGMALAAIFYLALRGGFLSVGTEVEQVNQFGVAALAGLTGMFSKQATDKLSEVFTTLFRTAPGGGDDQRKDQLGHPAPALKEVSPPMLATSARSPVIDVTGTGFTGRSVVRVNGADLPTRFVDTSRLQAVLRPQDVATDGGLEITVFTPPPGGGTTEPIAIQVLSAEFAAGIDDAEMDGCEVAITHTTPDEELPEARGGVSAS